jgi:hypothetical protein
MLVLRAYCDESGFSQDPAQSVVAIGGCVGTLEAWEKFDGEWKTLLREFNVSELHMKNYAHSVGEFTIWENNERKRRAFMGSATELMGQHIAAYIGAAIYLPDFACLPSTIKQRLGDPYFVCFQVCCRSATIQTLEDPAERIDMVFSKRKGYQGKAREFFYRLQTELVHGEKLGGISFESPKDVVQLQAADLVAFELHRFTKDRIALQPDPNADSVRYPMGQILVHSPGRTFFNIFYREALEKWARKME